MSKQPEGIPVVGSQRIVTMTQEAFEKYRHSERDSKSLFSRSSRASSTVSNAAIKARAKAEAARVRVEYMRRVAHLLKQDAAIKEEEALSHARMERVRSEILTDIKILNEEKECAEAEAEAEVFDIELSVEQSDITKSDLTTSDMTKTVLDRTRNYVESQIALSVCDSKLSASDEHQRPEHHGQPDERQHPEYHGLPDERQRPEHHGPPDEHQRPEHHGQPDERQHPEYHGLPDERQHPEYHGLPDERQRPEHHGPPDERQRPEHHGPPDEHQRPEYHGLPDERQRPEHRGPPDEHQRPEYHGPPGKRQRPEHHGPPDEHQRPEYRGPRDERQRPEYRGPPDERQRPEYRGPPDDRQHPEYHGLPDERQRPEHHGPPDEHQRPEHHGLPGERSSQEHQGLADDRRRQEHHGLPGDGQRQEHHGIDVTIATELSKFFVKKDLLFSRLTAFNDAPEEYVSWKTGFNQITQEMGVSVNEEVDLLIKWLGPESRKHAISLKASYVGNPYEAKRRIWERLQERYGSPEVMEATLKAKITHFPKLSNHEHKKLYELSDLLSQVEATMDNPTYRNVLGYFNSSTGVNLIVQKLPYHIQNKWTQRAAKYMKEKEVPYPPFHVFRNFVHDMCSILNNPSFMYEDRASKNVRNSVDPTPRSPKYSVAPVQRGGNMAQKGAYKKVSVTKTGIAQQADGKREKVCPLHGTAHTLNECKGFRSKRFDERKRFIKEHNLCFKCCESDHKARDCLGAKKCSECNSEHHPTALHITPASSEKATPSSQPSPSGPPHGGEKKEEKLNGSTRVEAMCTQICGTQFSGKSCAKMVLVKVYHKTAPEKSVQTYAIIDDQSNRTLARSDLFDILGLKANVVEYALNSCSGCTVSSGRMADGCVVEALDGSGSFEIPSLLECDNIPNVREEIPTPDVAAHHPHLKDIVSNIPPLNEDAEILLLIGRDMIDVHHVHDHRRGGANAPYAQKLGLGWVIIGETCLGRIHMSNEVNVNKIHLLQNGRASIFNPCSSNFKVSENQEEQKLFETTKADERPGLSVDDREFLETMKSGFTKDSSTGNWTAPLPFRANRDRLPNNRIQAERRARALDKNLRQNQRKRQLFVEFMGKVIENGHAERAPALRPEQERWYLPVFGVFHPKKPDQIRCVFDSSAAFNGISLNNVLIAGPDMTNNLVGVLLRFRREEFAIMADIQQMFYSFFVQENHRDYLRFLWYEENNPEKAMVEYRMCVHVFGNSPSPAVATYGLRKTVEGSDDDVKEFVTKDFYVDDGLTSKPTPSEAISLMQRTRSALQDGGLRLHKIASNSEEVLLGFPTDDLAKGLKDLDIQREDLPTQRSLGLQWDLMSDTFVFNVSPADKPYTRRGVLSVINSIYDPLGFIAPVTIKGRLIMRDLMSDTTMWDEPLPENLLEVWECWRESLISLCQTSIPRVYSPVISLGVSSEVYMFSDASEKAIAAVGYLVAISPDGVFKSSFLIGKAKVAPSKGHTIPRLELCAAVLSVDVADIISEQLEIPIEQFKFRSDSRVVLGYIGNRTRRFHTYVANRVERIHRSSKPSQWGYIRTDVNPADCATRGVQATDLQNSMWLEGPSHLGHEEPSQICAYPLVEPDIDKEVRQEVHNLKTAAAVSPTLGSDRFTRFSCWRRLVEAVARLKYVAKSHHRVEPGEETHATPDFKSTETFREAERLIIKTVQQEYFMMEIKSIRENKQLPKDSPIRKLDPFVDSDGVLRVGGRIKDSDLTTPEKIPIIIPGKNHIAILLVRHHHESVQHQGRHFTEGAVRAAGFWIVGGRRLISSLIYKCVTCSKLRGKLEQQKMADLPADRLTPAPAFTYVGVDAFGPWSVQTRRTRGGQANSKRWAILFTCLTIRAIHIEVVDEMSSSAFINALRRFISVRGKVKEFRSDRGTNFTGACEELGIPAIKVEQQGVTRRILDSMLSSERNLTHDVLVTLMAEACAIVNSRPLVPVSSDSEVPDVLSPSTLLTFKPDSSEHSEGTIDLRDTYRKQWKHVRHLADVFWCRWRKEFLQSLQQRRKWTSDKPNIREGDVVLLRDKEVGRSSWPLGRVAEVFPSTDTESERSSYASSRTTGSPSMCVQSWKSFCC